MAVLGAGDGHSKAILQIDGLIGMHLKCMRNASLTRESSTTNVATINDEIKYVKFT